MRSWKRIWRPSGNADGSHLHALVPIAGARHVYRAARDDLPLFRHPADHTEPTEALSHEGGRDAEEVFDARVRGRKDVDYDRYLGQAGLRLSSKEEHREEKGFLGVKLKSEGGRTTVTTELAGSPAEAMGLSVNDEILAVGGFRMGSDKLPFFVGTMKPGETIRLTIARNGKLMEVSGLAGRRPTFEYRIQPVAGATDDQKALFKGWLLAGERER
jgi:predicted metalloprotease with PDZ domain